MGVYLTDGVFDPPLLAACVLDVCCDHCGSANVIQDVREYSYGVFAPDGIEEHLDARILKCLDCGAMETL